APMARIQLADGSVAEGQLLSETVVTDEPAPQEEPMPIRQDPAVTATIIEQPAALQPSHDSVEILDALEVQARCDWQVAVEAAQQLIASADRGAYQRAVDEADRALQRVTDDVSTRKRALTL